jgi:hypothetical protein
MPKTETELRDALHDHFGIDLDTNELAGVHAAIRRFSGRKDTVFDLD